MTLTERREYMIRNGEALRTNFVSTGLAEVNRRWGNGLQQFVELKHKLKMTPVSLVTHFMSNIAFFKQYGKNIFGVTGISGIKN